MWRVRFASMQFMNKSQMQTHFMAEKLEQLSQIDWLNECDTLQMSDK